LFRSVQSDLRLPNPPHQRLILKEPKSSSLLQYANLPNYGYNSTYSAGRKFCVLRSTFLFQATSRDILCFHTKTGKCLSVEPQHSDLTPRHLYYCKDHDKIYGFGDCNGILCYSLTWPSNSSSSPPTLGKPRLFGHQHIEYTVTVTCDKDYIYGLGCPGSRVAVFFKDSLKFARYYETNKGIYLPNNLSHLFFISSYLAALSPTEISLLFDRDKNLKPLFEHSRTYRYNPLNMQLLTSKTGTYRDVQCYDNLVYCLAVTFDPAIPLNTIRIDYYLLG
jgi:hypothetical protein